MGAIASFRQYRRSQRALIELSVLDDRLLQDIGINRSDIERYAFAGPRAGDHA
jgi:uncharacterized protein YjiS (DUF1127 family)